MKFIRIGCNAEVICVRIILADQPRKFRFNSIGIADTKIYNWRSQDVLFALIESK